MTERPVYGITVLRYADGRTEVTDAETEGYDCLRVVPMPGSWQHRHRMLIDAAAEVKREAGVPTEVRCTVSIEHPGDFGILRWDDEP